MNTTTIVISIFLTILVASIFFLIQDEIRTANQNIAKYRAYCKKLMDENNSLTNQKPIQPMKTLDQLIAETKGKFFSVTFVKKDGTVRTVNGKDKYYRLIVGTKENPNPNPVKNAGYVSFVNRNKESWASAHKNGVIVFKCGKVKAEFIQH